MQHVADDVLCVVLRLLPGHLDGAGRQRLGPHHCGGPGEPVGPQHGEAGAGLRGAGAVLGDALVDGVIVLADAVDGQRAAGEREINKNPFCCYIFGQMIKQYKRANVSSRL